jgi:glycosyltransferase involved in cell wall biosynthesis
VKTNPCIFVVVPAYNEAKAIRATLAPLLALPYQIVVVDDGSKDNTFVEAQKLPVHLLRHPINLGQGAALQTGMTFALKHQADVIVHMDADGQHSANELSSFIQPILENKADVVLGSRFMRAADKNAVPLTKRFMLKGATIVNGLLTGMWLTDAHNGYRAFSKDAAAQIHLKENRFAHASEILVQIHARKLRWMECPTHISYSGYSQAKGQPMWNAFNILIDVILRRFFP